jgi:hypothetical protein
VRVDVDQSWGDDLAARVNRVDGVAFNVDVNGGDLTASNRYVADCVDPNRGVDNAPALDNQIVSRRERRRNAGEQRSAGGAGIDKLASVDHGRQLSERFCWRD